MSVVNALLIWKVSLANLQWNKLLYNRADMYNRDDKRPGLFVVEATWWNYDYPKESKRLFC